MYRDILKSYISRNVFVNERLVVGAKLLKVWNICTLGVQIKLAAKLKTIYIFGGEPSLLILIFYLTKYPTSTQEPMATFSGQFHLLEICSRLPCARGRKSGT